MLFYAVQAVYLGCFGLFSLFIPAVWVVYYCSGCLFRLSYRCHSAVVAVSGGSVISVIIVRLEHPVLHTANIDSSSGLYRGLLDAYRIALIECYCFGVGTGELLLCVSTVVV